MWEFVTGRSPIVAAAIHNGHDIRPDLQELLHVSESTRLREEDPYMEELADITDNRIILQASRFEFDLNRRPGNEVYIEPKDAWGLQVWKKPPDPAIVEELRSNYRRFYEELAVYLKHLLKSHQRLVVFDIHSYNHHRLGKDAEFDDPLKNPEIIIGTSNMDLKKWKEIVEIVEHSFISADYFGRKLDVRMNIKYPGGNFARWIHRNFPENICVFSIEFKKIFMDEWTGELYPEQFSRLHRILQRTADEVLGLLT